MINPYSLNIKNNKKELEEFILFSVAVAGKSAKQISIALDKFLYDQKDIKYHNKMTPFDIIRFMVNDRTLFIRIKKSGLGKYHLLTKAYRQLVLSQIDLKTCSTNDLENIIGIGFKTSRFFIGYTRPNIKVAILDTHILKYLRNELNISDVPKSTPSSYNTYQKFENIFLKEAEKQKKSIKQLDLEIWNKYSRK